MTSKSADPREKTKDGSDILTDDTEAPRRAAREGATSAVEGAAATAPPGTLNVLGKAVGACTFGLKSLPFPADPGA